MSQRKEYGALSEEKKALLKGKLRGDAGIIAKKLNLTQQYVRDIWRGKRQNYRVWIELAQIVQARTEANRKVGETAFQMLVETGIEQMLKKYAGKIVDLEFEEIRKEKQAESAALFEEFAEDGRKLSEQIQIIKQNLEAENRAKT